MGTACSSSRACNRVSSSWIESSSAATLLGARTSLPGCLFKLGFELIEVTLKGTARPSGLRPGTASYKLSQGRRGLFFCASEFVAGFGESHINVAGLASLLYSAAEQFHIPRSLLVSPLFLVAALIWIVMGA